MTGGGRDLPGRWLPHPQLLRIDDTKITGYLLNLDHPDGAAKAKFFLSKGFSLERLEEFKIALRSHAEANEIAAEEAHAYGVKSIVECAMEMPSGSSWCIRAVWNDHQDGRPPRLITAHPLSPV